MLFRSLDNSSKTELLTFLVSRYDANPVALSDVAISRFIDANLRASGFDVRVSPSMFRRVLKLWNSPEGSPMATDNDPRFPPVDDGEALP
ncbi:hypothetical protein [Bradyrhizobium diazoefficiens]|uniref:Uncharacterized protein n=1 Tax=Bradyrhizobium diazoefficiens TaxID=1355477 RepID=A0A809Z5Y5_9BRAD|nr:hypothetical protein [Bradyrhizobium diazoefficiens]QLD45907.1 hypothetical protein HUW42_35130 [Bradyrhizobium diazoefficiens]WLA72241.1 hypothetical protein QIH77_35955 [Bradyrhizobium diazoefficiens]BCE19817.1 hypothetical protein XF1B_24980 [Bradyrhizobium diazoefficiens]BCE46070.1 hypothetical protein XF4B_24190 [Bradyrhizobium diazoefficiens]BCE63563.1 hypothetical protein XF6B_23620 [Bradyrhizobium diazoefficiens]